ncbi:hypothetical protein Zmor_022988 [Zophobas morio]|uniref:Uncharacterized protein n=1 Tax=Zophobas morio TaxID=2755281 RepID=A0AA38M7E7_9CUCU|nr:hypothetical protein Zmor_022988 [Zophobas morio]
MNKEEGLELTLTLLLGYSEIEKIHPKTFDGLSIGYMDLSHNKLNELPGEIFTGTLAELMLNNNTLEHLPDSFFQQNNLKRLNIHDNPLKCGTLQKLKKFAEKNFVIMEYDNRYC